MSSTAVSPAPAPASGLHERLRNPSDTQRAPPLPHRRSSVLSYASRDETRQSVSSSTGDFILPKLGLDQDHGHDDGSSHWHSSPLAFAILPAIAGLFFQDGSVFVTDILLLGLAAVFLNWSVRLPWRWYHSSQAVLKSPSRRGSQVLEDISEEEQSPSNATPSLKDSVQSREALDTNKSQQDKSQENVLEQDEEQDLAAQQLRTHENMALLSTFLFPALGAYLLHVIRGQLSRPSTGLVSDYNLSIFLLAAEIRPFRHLVRLVTNRTLHLQRVATGNDHFTSRETSQPSEFTSRLEALEARMGEQVPSPVMAASQKEDLALLQLETRKRYEPRLDALERAVRRYEKRATTLTLLTEQRLQSLESRLQDALSLAAVAAQSSQKPGVIATALGWISKLMMIPLEALWMAIVWPLKVAEDVVCKISELVLGPTSRGRRKGEQRSGRTKGDKRREDAYNHRNN